ncbi:stigma-specific STIG1-like protein 3 [Oryza brachyantha]|uniref:4Fe-4S ferredoxin-type domain-containing protein n=1 Tax=Oryza brachyantha TaxID=4533 RepID=J3M5F8_ORYBR|nr:stigma-specific STIG1-like protein 3 [Oryza brachyantha]
MAKATILLLLVLAAAAAMATTGESRVPLRRSRFLMMQLGADPHYCSKKTAAVCLAPGSPGPTSCGGQCVDTATSGDHCGGCNKACKHGRTCCGGRCVDLLSDGGNCRSCFNQCSNKCTYGFCDYAI